MKHVFPLIFLLAVILAGTANPCLAQQATIRPLERGNATASWTQVDGVNVLSLRGTARGGSLVAANIAGFVADRELFNSIDFDLDGEVRLFVRGSFENRFRQRVADGLLELKIKKIGKGFKRVSISAFDQFIFRGLLERDIQVNREAPILLTGVGKLRNIRVNGRLPIISTQVLFEVPPDLRRGPRVELRPLWVGR